MAGSVFMAILRRFSLGYTVYFLVSLTFSTCNVINYTVVTPPTIDSGFVVNLTTTGEPEKEIITTNDSSYDIIAEFLEKVEAYEKQKYQCKPGTDFNLGEGVIQQYGINRFKRPALTAVNRANFLTRIWRNASQAVLDSEYLLYTQVRNMVEGDPDIFAAGNCYDHKEYKNRHLFCPYAYRTENGTINVKDLSIEYDYLGNGSEWFYEARQHAEQIENFNFTVGKFSIFTVFPSYSLSHTPSLSLFHSELFL